LTGSDSTTLWKFLKYLFEMSRVETSTSDLPADAARVSQYWEQQFEKNRADTSLWTNNNIVTRQIYRLISGGSEEHWLPWFFNHYLEEDAVFERSLSVCCGDGAHELGIAKTGKVRFVRAFDLSEGAIAQAKAAFEKAKIPKDNYAFEVADANDLQMDDRFDLILTTGALHHVTNLEGLLTKLSSMLRPEGYFVTLEYVGPNRFQWTDTQLSVINGILQQLDLRYLKESRRIELGRPSIPDFIAIDPSEAVRSEDILGLLPEFFTIEYLRNFNGTVMHPLYPLIEGRFTNANEPGFDSIVRMILWIEDFLIREKVLSSDFAFVICRRKERPEHHAPLTHSPTTECRLVGYIDLFDQNAIAGWAANVKTPTVPVSVDVYIDDRLQATLLSDGCRQDVKEAGYGDGRKGFTLALPPARSSSPGRIAKLLVAGSNQVLATRLYDAE
jgi:SAM-dependent methyltransferase